MRKKLIATRRSFFEEFIRNRGIVLLTMILGFIGAVLHATILPEFETVAFLTFLGPIGLGAYGIKTYRATQEDKIEQIERSSKVDPLMG